MARRPVTAFLILAFVMTSPGGRAGVLAEQLLNTAVCVGDDIVDVTTDQQEIPHATP